MVDEPREPPAPAEDGLELLRGVIFGVFTLFWLGGGGALCAALVGGTAADLGGERVALVAALVGAVLGVGLALLILVPIMNVPQLAAARRLLAVLGFGLLAAAGTWISPIPGTWGVFGALGAGSCAAGLAGAALLTERPRRPA